MKRICKISQIFFLTLILVCASALLMDNTTSNVQAKTATKLKMKKKKISVIEGEKKQINVTVQPKKAKIKWSSNKKKIAKVNKKGVVQGIKKGTAKITAKSGKKKAVCTVKVKANKAGIQSVSVLNTKAVRITLSQAVSIQAKDVSIKKKSDGKGAYNRTLSIGSLTKVSSKVYDVVLKTDTEAPSDINCILSEDYVQVTIKKLKKNNTKELVYYPSTKARNIYETALVGKEYSTSIGFSQSYKGYASGVKVSGVPSGLKAKICGSTVYLEGKPTQAKASVMTITGKDEMNKKLEQKVYWYIGSENVMLSYIETEGHTILTNDDSSEYFCINTVGGSGSKTYSLPGNTNKLISISDDEIYFERFDSTWNGTSYTKTYLNPGNYKVNYQVKDSKGHVSKGTLNVSAVKGVTVSGKVTAADNSGIENAYVHAEMEDNNHVYYRTSFYTDTYFQGTIDSSSTAKKNAGEYDMVVYPSKMYNFYAEENGMYAYVNAKNIAKSNVTLNFKLPLYKVTLACGSDDLSGISWRDADDDYVGTGKVVYLKKGNYQLTGSKFIYTYKANFTVSGNRAVTMQRTSNLDGTLTEGSTTTTSFYYDTKYFAFTPATSGSYTFSTEGNADIEASLRDSAGSRIASGSSYFEDGISMTANLTAGRTYYLELYVDNSRSDFDIMVNKASAPLS